MSRVLFQGSRDRHFEAASRWYHSLRARLDALVRVGIEPKPGDILKFKLICLNGKLLKFVLIYQGLSY